MAFGWQLIHLYPASSWKEWSKLKKTQQLLLFISLWSQEKIVALKSESDLNETYLHDYIKPILKGFYKIGQDKL